MKFIKTSAFLGLFFTANIAFATTIEAELHVPWNHLSLKVNLQKSHFDIEHTQFEFQSVPIELNHMKIEVESSSQELTHIPGPPLHSQLKVGDLAVQILVPAFHIKKEVIREINGAQIIVKLEAVCDSFKIKNSGLKVATQFDWLFDDQSVRAYMTQFSVAWPESPWSLSEIQCRGPIGFADLIQNELTKQLSHPESIIPILKEKIQESTNLKLADLASQVMNLRLSFLKDRIKSEFTRIKNLDSSGLTLALKITANDDNPQAIPYLQSVGTKYKNAQKPELSIPRAGVEQLIKASAKDQVFFSSENQLSSFKKLMRSRFLQFFLWPDLMNFKKSAVFKLLHRIGSSTKEQSSDSTKIELDAKSNFKLQLKGESWLQAERDQKLWNYVFFKTNLTAKGSLEIQNSNLSLKFNSRDLKITKQFANEYKSKYHPSERLSLSTIQSSLEESLFNSALNLELPTFEIQNGAKLKVQSLSVDADQNYNFSFKDF